jgi:hypothetical protein
MSFKHLLQISALAAAVALPSVANAQNAETVRAKCIADAGAAYPDDVRYEHQVARKQLYINCMQKAGLTP